MVEIGVADNLRRPSRIDIRILEQALSEFLHRYPVRRLVHSTLRHLPAANRFDDVLCFLDAAKLIYARIDSFGESISLRHRLHSPRHPQTDEGWPRTCRGTVLASGIAVVGDCPI